MNDKIIFKNFHNIVPMCKDRWTPIYLEHGHLEVENYSIKWIDSIGTHMSIPVAMLSCIILGPGSTITHAAIVSCSKTNTPIVWMGDDGLYYYATGVNVNERCQTTINHAKLYSNNENRLTIARKMFNHRFPDAALDDKTLDQMKGIEGNRIRNAYRDMSKKYSVEWACRNTNGIYGIDVDDLNLSLNILNFNLYCICLSVATTMGYIPALGFIHSDGKIPFIYDLADLYKVDITFDVAFSTYADIRRYNKQLLTQNFTQKVSEYNLMSKIPKDLKEIMKC